MTAASGRPARLRPGRGQRGSAALLVVVAAACLTVPLAAGTARLGEAAHRRARVDAVADLAALAAVTGGTDAAAGLADDNGGRLVAATTAADGATVVEVELLGVRSRAAAAPA